MATSLSSRSWKISLSKCNFYRKFSLVYEKGQRTVETSFQTLFGEKVSNSILLSSIFAFAASFILLRLSETNVFQQQRWHTFPKHFKWGVATSAFQIEGAIEADGRGPSIWDDFMRRPGAIIDNSTADIACGSYYRMDDDITIIKAIGAERYRFSISWSRIFPDGLSDHVNFAGVAYYKKLINKLIENNIEPMVTLYHWDLPLALQRRGGWLNPKIVEWFGEYARFCFRNFGDKVKWFVTINEPFVQTTMGYCGTEFRHAPDGPLERCSVDAYEVGRNFLLAHATAYHIYDREFRAAQKGNVGISNFASYYEPMQGENSSITLSAINGELGWFSHPIFHRDGDYPSSLKKSVAERSRMENRPESRLKPLTPEQKELLYGSADFLGLNYYTSMLVRSRTADEYSDTNFDLTMDSGLIPQMNDLWPLIGPPKLSWIRSYPEGLRKLLNFIRLEYDNVPVIITENGCLDTPDEGLRDTTRIRYVQDHLQALSQAINEDGCNVIGYTYWSLMDNFEWDSGYSGGFGLYWVNFDEPALTRKAKMSAEWFRGVIMQNAVPAT